MVHLDYSRWVSHIWMGFFSDFQLLFFQFLALVSTYSFTSSCKVERRLEPVNSDLESRCLSSFGGEEVDSLVPIVTCQIFIFWGFLSQQSPKIYFHYQCAECINHWNLFLLVILHTGFWFASKAGFGAKLLSADVCIYPNSSGDGWGKCIPPKDGKGEINHGVGDIKRMVGEEED